MKRLAVCINAPEGGGYLLRRPCKDGLLQRCGEFREFRQRSDEVRSK